MDVGVEGSAVLGSHAGGKDGAAMGTTNGGRGGGKRDRVDVD